MSILEYDEEREMELIRKAEYDVGKSEGIAEGITINLVAIIRKKLQKGVDEESIASFLEIEPAMVRQVHVAFNNHPDADDAQLANLLKIH